MTEYHDGVPVLLPADAERAADKLGIQVIGLRAGWSLMDDTRHSEPCGWCRDPYCSGDHSGDAAAEPWVPVEISPGD